MLDAETQALAVLVMGLATYATRAGGVALMSALPSAPRMESFLRHVSGSALAALVAPTILKGDLGMQLGTGVAVALALWLRRPMLALVLAVLVAALVRAEM